MISLRYRLVFAGVLCLGLLVLVANTNTNTIIQNTTISNTAVSDTSVSNTITDHQPTDKTQTDVQDTSCSMCYTGTVTRIVDGDTIHVDNKPIRLVLVDTPERGERNYDTATQHTRTICPVGTLALVDVDDLQIQDRYGRQIAKVTCNGTILNESLLKSNLAEVYHYFCSRSEFVNEAWLNNEC